jgi:predicted  nucleic acid-binding Zn-ribbon protein
MSNLHQEQILEQKSLREIYKLIDTSKESVTKILDHYVSSFRDTYKDVKNLFEKNKTVGYAIDPKLMTEIMNYLNTLSTLSHIMIDRLELIEEESERLPSYLSVSSGINVNKAIAVLKDAYEELLALITIAETMIKKNLQKTKDVIEIDHSGVSPDEYMLIYKMAPEEAEEKLKNIEDELRKTREMLESYREELIKKYKTIDMAPPDELRTLRILENKINKLKEDQESLLRKTNILLTPDEDMLRKYSNIITWINEALEPFGEKCGWTTTYTYAPDKLDLRLLLNDVANCAHSITTAVMKFLLPSLASLKEYKTIEEGSHSLLIEDVNPMIKEFIKRWEKYVEENYRIGYYYDEDYSMLSAVGRKNRVEMIVGSSPGHKTRVEVIDGSLYMRYFDTDLKVNETLHDLLTEKKFKCRIITGERFEDGVKCVKDNFTIEDIDALAKAISLVTSMDLNLSNRPDFVNNRIRDLFPEIFKEEVRK